jgi:SAM-dependent methyltransferase
LFGEKCGFSYDRCNECGTIFTNPRPSLDVLHQFYAQSKNYDYWNKYIFPVTEGTRREHIFRPRAEKVTELVEHFGIARGTLIEIGAAFGWFCEEIESLATFDRVIAVEPTPGLAATCRGKGIETFETPVEKLELVGIADVVVSFEVIEHLFSVHDFISQCSRLLKKNGLMVLTCPNAAGFDVGTLGLISNTFDHEHLNYFNTNSLPRLIENCGFSVLSVETPGKLDVDIVKRYVDDGTLNFTDNFFLSQIYGSHDPALLCAFQAFLSKNLMSSHMLVVCQKDE